MDELEINAPSDSQQAMADSASETSSLASLSAPSTPSMSSPRPSTSAAASECVRPKHRARGKPAAKKRQKLPPHGGKCVYYGCEKCQHMALNRAAFNEHVATCYGRNNSPRSRAVIDVRASFFDKAPVLGTCIYCEKYTHCVGAVLLCHEYICGERQWRGEVGDPPYVPPLKLWTRGLDCRVAPRSFMLLLGEFQRGGLWEVLEREYLKRIRLEHLLPAEREISQEITFPRRVTERPALSICSDKEVAVVRPQVTTNRRRYKERLINRNLEPACCTLMGSVYSIKCRCVVGHLVMVGEPRFGIITLEPMNEAHDKVTMYYRTLGNATTSPIKRPLAASIALYDVKTGKFSGILETADNPRHWETDYTILGNLDYDSRRCPGISVTYNEVPTELLKLFSADQMSPAGLSGRTQ